MKTYLTTVITKEIVSDMNWEVFIPRLEKREGVSNIVFNKDKNLVKYERSQKVEFEAENIEQANIIAIKKVDFFHCIVPFTYTTVEI